MKLTVLLDNNTLMDKYLRAEPGVSFFIEADGKKVLFDTGYSDLFITNAQKLSIDLLDVDFVVLSHGHLDHTWGLVPLVRLFLESSKKGGLGRKPALVAHPLTFSSRRYRDLTEIGSLLGEEQLSSFFDVRASREPFYLTDNLAFLGEIERKNGFEAQNPLGKIRKNGTETDDFIIDDSALAYKSPGGLVVITGCAHSGICNIVEYARKICGENRVADIVGGFHLQNPPAEQLHRTIQYMKALGPGSLHACHCTDLKSKIELAKVVALEEVGAGLTLEWGETK